MHFKQTDRRVQEILPETNLELFRRLFTYIWFKYIDVSLHMETIYLKKQCLKVCSEKSGISMWSQIFLINFFVLFWVSCTTQICCFMLFSFKSKCKECRRRIRVAQLTQNSIRYLCPTDILQNGADAEEKNCWIKSLFLFEKAFLSLHDSPIEPLMADGLFWRCISYFSGPWQWYLLGSQWHSHKPPGFHPKYLKLCSEEEQSFYRFGTIWG